MTIKVGTIKLDGAKAIRERLGKMGTKKVNGERVRVEPEIDFSELADAAAGKKLTFAELNKLAVRYGPSHYTKDKKGALVLLIVPPRKLPKLGLLFMKHAINTAKATAKEQQQKDAI